MINAPNREFALESSSTSWKRTGGKYSENYQDFITPLVAFENVSEEIKDFIKNREIFFDSILLSNSLAIHNGKVSRDYALEWTCNTTPSDILRPIRSFSLSEKAR